MNLSRCENGHFYDKEKYATCPHCSGGAASDESLTTVFTEELSTAPAPAPAPTPAPTPVVTPTPIPTPVEDIGLPIAGVSVEQPTVPIINDTPTVPLFMEDSAPVQPEPDEDDDHTVAFYDDVFSNATASVTAAPQPAVVPQPASAPVVNKVSTPCVGWLIALGGAHIGTDFRLKVGKNFLGRDSSMDIALTGDKSVSRNRHAVIVYEPKQHLYLIQPGESSGLVYRNNEVVLNPVKLEAYDMITVGDVNLLFMPLCGERFNWSDLLEELNKNK